MVTIVVDDGSSDATAHLARREGALVVTHPVSRGVGAAFSAGLEEALRQGADIIVNIDGDEQFDAADIPKVIAPLIQKRADFVTASRFADSALTPEMPAIKKWGNQAMSWLITSLTGQKFYDVSCGFRAYTRDAALNLNLMGSFTYTQETFLNLAFKNYRIVEVPVRVRGEREFGKSRVAGSIRRYALRSAKIIFRAYRDYKPFLFFGVLGGWCFALSAGLLGVFLWHYLRTGRFYGHLWAGFLGGGAFATGLILLVVATVADMLDRIRATQEKALYYLKRDLLSQHNRRRGDKP
jgi:glycosyltransferase involved in cell wall biosynthesis